MTDMDALDLSADAGLLNPAWAGRPVARATADRAFLQRMLEVEAAWVAVLAAHGLATDEQARQAEEACDPAGYDLVALARAAQGGGNPLIPALTALRERLPAGSAVHMGATSQDIIDTALMAMAAQVGRDLGALCGRAAVAEGHRAAVVAGALPTGSQGFSGWSSPAVAGSMARYTTAFSTTRCT